MIWSSFKNIKKAIKAVNAGENQKIDQRNSIFNISINSEEKAAKLDSINTSGSKKIILVLALSCIGQSKQELRNEVERIKNNLKPSYPDKFDVKGQLIATFEDLHKSISDSKPWIVHFSEHGKVKVEELAFENKKDGETQFVGISTSIMENFKSFAGFGVECFVLNSLYSKLHAKVISLHINYVIATEKVIVDDITRFSKGFYEQLREDFSLEKAYKYGCFSIPLTGKNSKPLFFQQHCTIQQLIEYGLKARKHIYNSYVDFNEKTGSCDRALNSSYKEILDKLQRSLSLLPEEARAINGLLLQFCEEDEKRRKEYTQKLKDVVEQDGKTKDQKRKELSAYRQNSGIHDEEFRELTMTSARDFYHNDKLEEAADLFNELIYFNENDPVAHFNLGYIYYQQGKRAEGINKLKRAKKLYQDLEMSDNVKQIEQIIESFRNKNIKIFLKSNIIIKFLIMLLAAYLGLKGQDMLQDMLHRPLDQNMLQTSKLSSKSFKPKQS